MNERPQRIEGRLVDLFEGRIFPASIEIVAGRIASVTESTRSPPTCLLPGFVDAHVHVESSMLVPREFARAAVAHGTVAAVSDPHEIANVLGVSGVEFMLENAADVPFRFLFGAPSCVPATSFETAGAAISAGEVERLLDDGRIGYLSEVMDVPGVLRSAPEVIAKIGAARERGKPVDGHAPGLRGEAARAYFGAGITTDHECVSVEEAREKIACGAKILIREGSAARNFDALCRLIDEHPSECMLCSDDKHPHEMLTGHIDRLVKEAVARGIDGMKVLRCACVNPVLHYGLDAGLLRPGDAADLIEVSDLESFDVLRTFVRGELVAEKGETLIPRRQPRVLNRFRARRTREEDFRLPCRSGRVHVIEAIDGQLLTRRAVVPPTLAGGRAVADPGRDLLKLAVINRYEEAAPVLGFARSFGLREGAIASSVAHDSHNVIAVGVSDEDLCHAVNLVIEHAGGLAVACGSVREALPLPIAGLMSTESCRDVGLRYAELDRLAKRLGTTLSAPFVTLSFLALLVIPEIRLSDRGLFDTERQEFLPLFV